MTKTILRYETMKNNMGLDVNKLLCEYFSKEEVKEALRDIGEPTTGTKEQLVDELAETWESHNRDKNDLLDFTDEVVLQDICSHYNLDDTTADHHVLKRRIKRANLLEWGEKSTIDEESNDPPIPKIKSKPDTGVTDVHFHIGSVTQSKGGRIGITIGIVGIIVTIIIALVV